ncbi:MAG: sterol desaturase family protein [Acidobacteriales bacterium]|nr:sterol desaturase family protein [Terriglobales bacterium]
MLYLFLAGLAWFLCYVLFKQRWVHRKIVMRFPGSSEVRREIRCSCFSLLIFSLVVAGTIWVPQQGWTRVYWRVADHGWPWFWASIVMTILLHDTYFYWTHRLMHHPRLFPKFHRVHHLSHNPSPWAAYAFDPAEAFVQAGIFPLTALLIPIHPSAFAIFVIWQIIHNILGHTGYEFHPRWLMKTPLKFFLTPTHHAMHHEKLRGNYGIYFNFWDGLMGTNHPHYEERFQEVTTREREFLPRT